MPDKNKEPISRTGRARLLVRAAVAEMLGRDDPMVGSGMGTMGKVMARFQGYKEVSTFDISRTSYSFARAIFFANIYRDRKTGKEYGKEYLLGAPFGKPIVNIAAGFAIGSPVQITESGEITEEDDTADDTQDNPVVGDSPEIVESNSTISNTNRMLQDRRDTLFKAVRNSYRDGDFFIAVEDDGEFTLLPPEDVDIIANPNNPDAVDGYDVFSTFPDLNDPTGAKTLMFVDEIRRAYRRRCEIDRTGKRTEVPGTLVEYRNLQDGGLEERQLPIVHFANEKEARSLYGVSEFQNLYYLMANYHEVLSAAIKGNIYNSTAVPVIQGVKNMRQFLQQNFTQDKDGNYILKWDSQKMLVVGEGGSVQILQADGTAADAQTLLEILFYLICQSSETPEFAFGTAVQSSKASVSEQTPMLIKKAIRKQGELEAPLRKLIELYIDRMAILRPEEFDVELEFTITMPSILDEDLNINIQIVNAMLEKGIITEETAMTMLNLGKYIKNFEEERRRARLQKDERSPIPTDVFGQPLNSVEDEELNKNKSENALKQSEIDEMKKHKDTRSIAEMLEKNLNVLTLTQIQEMNPHRGSEGKNPKVVQETTKVPVKSGNPYRDKNGRFGSAEAIVDKESLEDQIANANDMSVDSALYNYQDYHYQNINEYLYLRNKLDAGETLDKVDQQAYDKLLKNEDDILSHIKAIDGQFAKESVKDQHLYRTDPNLLFTMIQDNPELKNELTRLSAENKIPKNHEEYYTGDGSYEKALQKHLIGETFRSGAYISTSRTLEGAEKFGDGSSLSASSAEARIILRGKSKGIKVDDFTGSGVEGNIENETLLPRGTGFMINGIRLMPTSRENYSGSRGEVFFVEIMGEIVPMSLDEIKEMKDSQSQIIQETSKIPVKSGNPYRSNGGRFGSKTETDLSAKDVEDPAVYARTQDQDYNSVDYDSVFTYQTIYYQYYNEVARNGIDAYKERYKNFSENAKKTMYTPEELVAQSARLDAMILRNKTKESFKAYRIVNSDKISNLADARLLSDKGFLSTSLSKDWVNENKKDWEYKKYNYVLEINVPKGTRGIFPESITRSGTFIKEAEFLMGRNTKLKPTGSRTEDGITYIQMEVDND